MNTEQSPEDKTAVTVRKIK